MVQGCEQDFAQFCESRFCVGVGSSTDALRFALIAASIRSGDIVVTVPNSFIAMTEAISQAGAHPDFVDIDERTYNLDPGKLRQYLEKECSWDSGAKRAIHKRTGNPVTAVIPDIAPDATQEHRRQQRDRKRGVHHSPPDRCRPQA